MPNFGFDEWIDAQLRNVQLPPDLLSRLADCGPAGRDTTGRDNTGRNIASHGERTSNTPRLPHAVSPGSEFDGTPSSDDDGEPLERESIPLIPPLSEADTVVDAALMDVTVPSYLETRLRRISRTQRRWAVWQQVGLAASIFIMVGGGAALYVGMISGGLGPALPGQGQVARQPAENTAPTSPATASRLSADRQIAAQDDRSENPGPQFRRPGSGGRGKTGAGSDSSGSNATDDRATEGGLASADAARPATAGQGSNGSSTVKVHRLPFPTIRGMASMSSSLKQALDARRRSLATLGAGGAFDPLPRLDEMEVPTARGISPPRVAGYDLLFQLKHNEHPFASPAAHKELLSSKLPLVFQTVSYDRAWHQVLAGQLPAAEEIRVEDFLAAQNYPLPAGPLGSLELHTAMGLSPLGEPATSGKPRPHMLQLAVRAGHARSAGNHPPVRLLAAIDMSSRMSGGARLEVVRRALEQLSQQMGPKDRVTLIGFAERTHTLAESLSAQGLRSLLASGDLPQPNGLANLPQAIQATCDAAMASPGPEPCRMVLMTAGRGDFDEATRARSGEALANVANKGIAWQIIRLAVDDQDEQFATLAEAGHGTVSAALSAADIYGVLLERLTGAPPAVARGAALKLTFNPQVVTGYRLLGHEAATLTGPASNAIEVDLLADQTATGMYELWIKPKGEDRVATAELTWRDPHTNQPRRVVHHVTRGQIVSLFGQAPAWFQQGVIAAKTAEVLRGSTFVPVSRPLSQLQHLTTEVDPQLADQPDFQNLVEMIKHAEKLR